MERIKEAIELAKRTRGDHIAAPAPDVRLRRAQPGPAEQLPAASRQVTASPAHLEEMRIIAQRGVNAGAAAFDLLRTRLLQQMLEMDWKTVLITSPSPGCGKTVTAINLAFSITRQTDSQAILVDFDLRKPQIAATLGIPPGPDALDVVAGRARLEDALVQIEPAGARLRVLPTFRPAANPSEVLTSPGTRALMQSLRALPGSPTIIFDMPPMLVADDVIAFLPQVDCVLLMAAAGHSKAKEIDSCRRNVPEAKFLGVVLSKATETTTHYY